MDTFDVTNLSPMKLNGAHIPFNSSDWIYELKLDGIRCLCHLDETSTRIYDENQCDLLSIFPELSNLHQHVQHKCILDGELIILKNGVSDYMQLQIRKLNRDEYRNKEIVPSYFASVVAFDILSYEDNFLFFTPLSKRKEILENVVEESLELSISRYVDTYGMKLFQLAISDRLEGVIAKRKNSFYHPGRFTSDWTEFLYRSYESKLLCGIYVDASKNRFAIIGNQKHDLLFYEGMINLCTYETAERKLIESILSFAGQTSLCPLQIVPVFSDEVNVIWLKKLLPCSIELEHAHKSNYHHATLRDISFS